MALLVALACAQSCSRSESSAPRPADAAATAPVPAPADLAAELVVPRPGELWQALRTSVGPSLGYVPASFELLLATLLELPAVAASGISADRPLVGALLVPQAGEPGMVFGVRLTSGAELIARIATGPDAPFTTTPKAFGLTLLGRKKGSGLALGVLADHLLAARQAAELESVGPWLVRTLARKAPPSDALVLDVPESALSGALTTALSRSWQAYQQELREIDRAQRQEKGRAPDFGDPAALIGAADQSVRALLDLLATMQRARLRLVPGAESLRFELELEPAPGRFAEQTIAALPAGNLDAMLGLPRETALAIMLRSTPLERAQAAKDAGLGLEQLLGTRLSEHDRQRLHDSLAAVHEGRGDGTLYGLLSDRTLFVQTDVSDEAKLRRGVEDTLRALELPALKAPLSQVVGDFTLQSSTQAMGELEVRRFLLRPRKTREPTSFEALFATRRGRGAFVLGAGARPVLERLLAAPAPGLGSDPGFAALAAELGKDVAFAVFADAAALGFADAKAGSAPALLVLGRRGRSAQLTLSCSGRALATLLARLREQGK